MTTGIWWIRRDLRLEDNPALQEATDKSTHILPLFILDPNILARPAEMRKAFMFEGLAKLDQLLREQGSRLFVLSGDPLAVLTRVTALTGPASIFAEADYSPYARTRDHAIAEKLPLWLVHGLTVFPPGTVRKDDGNPYTVYTPFSRTWKAYPLPSACCSASDFSLPPLPAVLPDHEGIPAPRVTLQFEAGPLAALERLHRFMDGPVFEYTDRRNLLAEDGTSMLSPYLRFGMVSIRDIVQEARFAMENAAGETARRNAETYLNELIWREFYYSILHYFPEVLKTSFRKDLRNIPWRNAPEELEAWKQGMTGYPVVDAGMRQLRQSGWMHNRARMITASFLVKDLLINWQEGEAWFMQNLLDGDPASNNGGWQWTAGVGTDAAPYFRIFNPVLQGQKFDPEGKYIRRWVPELAAVPGDYIHQPWLMPVEEQRRLGMLVGKNYPAPIVDHRQIKERTLAAYKSAGEGFSAG